MAHYDIFREQLAINCNSYGHALWEPGPGELYTAVTVGDVGYIRLGKFHRLFNALLPADHPSQRLGVPEYHEPLTPNVADHIDRGVLHPTDFRSTAVTVAPGGEGSFLCQGKRGAVLSLPVDARREDTIAKGDFGRWMIKHIDNWFSFTQRHGLGIDRMEDIVLVTGCHRARSSTNVVFENQVDEPVSFGVQVAGDTITWQFPPIHTRGVVLNRGPGGTNLPENQCLFIRGFRATRRLKLLPRQLRGAAGDASNSNGHDSEPEVEPTSVPMVTKYRDPLHLLIDHVAERAPDCDIILIHDDDLEVIDGIFDGNPQETLSSDAIMDHLQSANPEVKQVPCDWLFTREESPRTTAEIVTVAVLSKEFHRWSQTSGHANNQVLDPSVPPNTVHRYNLVSWGVDYVLIEVISRAPSVDDHPLLYTGEELKGFIVLSLGSLEGLQRIDVVLKVFDSDHNITLDKAKHTLFPQHVNSSSFVGGQLRWPFSFLLPAGASSSTGVSAVPSTLGRHSSYGYDCNSNPNIELLVTMRRRGMFVKNVKLKKQICYASPPDTSMPSCASPASPDHRLDLPVNSSWSHQKLPAVLVKGVLFGHYVEVECKLEIPISYPISDSIPLRLIITSQSREAVTLASISHVIDVRLFKLMAFGKRPTVNHPFSPKDRSSYHSADLVAEAKWEPDGSAAELPASEVHPLPRWRIKLNGEFRRDPGVDMCPSFSWPSAVIKYLVYLYPFRSADFQPKGHPTKPLLIAYIPLTEQR